MLYPRITRASGLLATSGGTYQGLAVSWVPRILVGSGIANESRYWEFMGESRNLVEVHTHPRCMISWFPGAIMRTLLGEPTGTSPKFASMMETAVLEFMEKHEVTLEKVTSIPLEGDGTIERRVEKCVFFCPFLPSTRFRPSIVGYTTTF